MQWRILCCTRCWAIRRSHKGSAILSLGGIALWGGPHPHMGRLWSISGAVPGRPRVKICRPTVLANWVNQTTRQERGNVDRLAKAPSECLGEGNAENSVVVKLTQRVMILAPACHDAHSPPRRRNNLTTSRRLFTPLLNPGLPPTARILSQT